MKPMTATELQDRMDNPRKYMSEYANMRMDQFNYRMKIIHIGMLRGMFKAIKEMLSKKSGVPIIPVYPNEEKDFYEEDGRIFHVKFRKDGDVEIGESCDRYFIEIMSRDKAVEELQKMIDFIKSPVPMVPKGENDV